MKVLAEQEAKRERVVLTVCLGEIARSRPFLIGLLGDRYGWVPPREPAQAAATEAGFDGDVENRSITDLEIHYGVLASADQQPRSWFYLREPLPYAKMLPEDAERYSDEYSSSPDAGAKVIKLKALKENLKDAAARPGPFLQGDVG